MSFSTTYVDETGRSREVSISDSDSHEALRNDYNALMKTYNPKYVTIERLQAAPGEELHLRVTVHAPSHYLTSSNTTNPQPCSSMSAEVAACLGYPLKSVSAWYPKDRFLASPNVFRSGKACIDRWIPFKSSLLTVVEKLVMDMIHNPVVTRYDSMANSSVEDWHKKNAAKHLFPTMKPKLLYAVNLTPLPPRRTAAGVPAPQPLPPRRR